MIDGKPMRRELVEGRPVLLAIDIQGGDGQAIPMMEGYAQRMRAAATVIAKARACRIPVVFSQEVHRADMVDFGRELDGTEDVHLLEGVESTAIDAEFVELLPKDYVITKRRYSCFYGTDLEILLKGLHADTLILVGSLTDVCVHYTFVDGHQHDYFCRIVEDCVCGSGLAAHEAALNAMEYLQAGARRTSEEVMAAFEVYARDQVRVE